MATDNDPRPSKKRRSVPDDYDDLDLQGLRAWERALLRSESMTRHYAKKYAQEADELTSHADEVRARQARTREIHEKLRRFREERRPNENPT